MTQPVLRAAGLTLPLGARPLLMGIVNATPDSFSDAGEAPTLGAQDRRRHGIRSAFFFVVTFPALSTACTISV